ncbi:probable ATP-dependent RNA helicase DDX52 isoform X2 [Mytilus trossulus]|uniref:probable ATP-dependent RNA helicase DDX52 isoform X2 n=1 Tax=Mytilus trossulus TaxID=6551 RepID=UPI0030067E3C
MEGLQLFRKLGVGAKFDLKRFGKDAEKLKIISKDLSFQNTTLEKADRKETNELKRKNVDVDSTALLKKVKDSESESNSESDSSSSEDDSTSEPEPETELQILGKITSKGTEQRREKKKKVKTKEKLAALHQEEVNRIRNQHKIHIYGTDKPEPLKSFDDLVTNYKMSDDILKNIAKIGYTEPTPIQRQTIPAMLHRREIMACAPTGSGKTAAFILPIIHHLGKHSKHGFRALVLAPTRELAKQIYRDFQMISDGTGLKLHYIDKTVPENEGKSVKKFDILVSTPNRLIYQLNQDPPQIDLHTVEWLIVDESDKLFEEGKSGFRDQLAVIYKACDSKNVRRAMFSATFAYDVEQWCRLNLDNVIQVNVGARNSATQTVEQELQFVGTEFGKLFAIREIIHKGIQPPVLVFVQSKERAQELFNELIYDGMNVDAIHSGKTQAQRDEVVMKFRLGKVWILICTELMGRGIDFKGVNLVINYDFPNSAITYIHRIGRTGRAGRSGKAITFFTEDDKINLRSIANIMVEAGCPVPPYMLQMKKPTKKKRRRLAKRVPEREHISTALKADLEKAKRKRDIIRKVKLQKIEGSTVDKKKLRRLKAKSKNKSDVDNKNPTTQKGKKKTPKDAVEMKRSKQNISPNEKVKKFKQKKKNKLKNSK